MTYTIAWDNNDRTCILLTFAAGVTWDIIYTACDELYTMMQSVDHPVDFISDITSSPNMPKENASTHVRVILSRMPANAGMHIVVTRPQSLFTITLLNSIFRLIGWSSGFAMATSMGQARDLIQQRRSRTAA
jgi:hypothetical protein